MKRIAIVPFLSMVLMTGSSFALTVPAIAQAPANPPANAPLPPPQPNGPQPQPNMPPGPRPMPPGARYTNLAMMPLSMISAMATLTDDQKTKIAAIQTKLQSDIAAARQAGTNGQRTPTWPLTNQANQDITAVLTPDQVTAIQGYYPGVQLLMGSIHATPDDLDTLNLTTDQLNQLKALGDDYSTKQRAIMDNERQQLQDLMTTERTAASGVLTADQKSALENSRHNQAPRAGNGAAPAPPPAPNAPPAPTTPPAPTH